jgi:peptidoglycan hydrolase-like protein with peptidoglycan-binding domain
VPVNRTWGIPMPSIYASTSTTCNLMYGDDPHRGSTRYGDPSLAIQVLQRNLNFCYGSKLAVDGIYGSNTRAVVRTVQRKHKLAVDGIYGPKTRSAMNWRLYSSATRSWSRSCSSPL